MIFFHSISFGLYSYHVFLVIGIFFNFLPNGRFRFETETMPKTILAKQALNISNITIMSINKILTHTTVECIVFKTIIGPIWEPSFSVRFFFRTENDRLAKNQKKILKKIPITKKT